VALAAALGVGAATAACAAALFGQVGHSRSSSGQAHSEPASPNETLPAGVHHMMGMAVTVAQRVDVDPPDTTGPVTAPPIRPGATAAPR
jgi:hypothetical protein